MFPNQFYMPARGLTPLLRRGINWSNILTNTQKTLNVINQAIPVYYQIKPIYNNAKTMFRMVNAIKSEDITEKKEDIKKNTDSTPVFFL